MAQIIQTFIADVNGDGVLDFVVLDSDHRWTAVNGRTRRTDDIPSFAPGHSIPGWPCWGRYFFADFTGNGVADRAYLSRDGGWFVVDASTGGPGVPSIPWGSKIPGWPGDGRIAVGDFNGDGRAERLYIRGDGSWFAVNSDGSPGLPGIPWGQQIPGWPGDGHYLLADFHGKGAVDRLYVSPAGKWHLVDSLTGEGGSAGMPWGHTIPGWPGGGRYLSWDVNGDGVADRIFIHPQGRLYACDSRSGSAIEGAPYVNKWGSPVSDAIKLTIELVVFQAAATGIVLGATAAATLGAVVGAVSAGLAVYERLEEVVEKNKKREHDVIRQRNQAHDRDREPYARAYPPEVTPPEKGKLSMEFLGVHDVPNCVDAGVKDCPKDERDHDRSDSYRDRDHGNDRDLDFDGTHDVAGSRIVIRSGE